MGLETVYPKPNTSVPNKEHEVFPYLLRDINITKPNQVWAADITYIRMKGSHVYLIAIMDWYSRYVIEWALSPNLEAEFCVEALRNALLRERCEIFNTDQGSQYTSYVHTQKLKDHGVTISMDGKGRATDNICIERFWRSAKCERIYLNEYKGLPDLRLDVADYIDFYNNRRFHESINYEKPMTFYWENLDEKKVA